MPGHKRDWNQYNKQLTNRDNLNFWITKKVLKFWKAKKYTATNRLRHGFGDLIRLSVPSGVIGSLVSVSILFLGVGISTRVIPRIVRWLAAGFNS